MRQLYVSASDWKRLADHINSYQPKLAEVTGEFGLELAQKRWIVTENPDGEGFRIDDVETGKWTIAKVLGIGGLNNQSFAILGAIVELTGDN